ncbi:hypothetical protein BB560_004574 [Smittium megazygosporum]|uniref:Cytochrome b-c1 complex subunit Rieske, mitochondrial n=1 Tax=Smittium megazygosporum TaxID=133381 RepID=A0A2T9Z8V7_9FUNG|nr:hypothetical protein BB560_004574 [Smittium megazygosporum]
MIAPRVIAANKTYFTAPLTRAAFNSACPNSSVKLSKSHPVSPQKAAVSVNVQQRFKSTYAVGIGSTKIPSFKGYVKNEASTSTERSKAFSYFMLGATGTVLASTAQATIYGFLVNLAASADVLAVSKIELDLSKIKVGESVTVKWRGKPVFIRHRTQAQIQESEAVPLNTLVDPQTDAERVKIPEWLILVGICTHLGCVPIKDQGDFGGYYCPCHGSHYDYSGRIRKGPAPLNLEVPDYTIDGNLLTIG